MKTTTRARPPPREEPHPLRTVHVEEALSISSESARGPPSKEQASSLSSPPSAKRSESAGATSPKPSDGGSVRRGAAASLKLPSSPAKYSSPGKAPPHKPSRVVPRHVRRPTSNPAPRGPAAPQSSNVDASTPAVDSSKESSRTPPNPPPDSARSGPFLFAPAEDVPAEDLPPPSQEVRSSKPKSLANLQAGKATKNVLALLSTFYPNDKGLAEKESVRLLVQNLVERKSSNHPVNVFKILQ